MLVTAAMRGGPAPRRRGLAYGGVWRAFVRTMEFMLLLALLAGVAYGVYRFAVTSGRFNVRAIRIEGANVLREEEIVAAAGVTSADNLLFLSASAVKSRVAAMPYVATCSVARTFPDTLEVRVTERSAVATLLVHNHLFEVDEHGIVLRELQFYEAHPGPYVSNVGELTAVEPGQDLSGTPLPAALEVWRAFEATEMGRGLTLSEIAAPSGNDIRVYCDELPFEIRWREGDYDKQAQRLDILWRTKEKWLPCAEYLDLRFDRDVACK